MARSILLHVYALGGGGAERVIASLASGLAERGHAVTLATDFEAPESAGLVSAEVRRVDLGRSHGRSVLRLARLIRTERPDATLSGIGASNLKHALAATLAGRGGRAILSFHGHIGSEYDRLSRVGNGLAAVLTRLTAQSVFVSDELARSFARIGASRARATRIYNPVPVAPTVSTAVPGGAAVLSVGRLVPTKGYDTLLAAFARLGRPDARLVILGEGPERGRLESQARALGLAGRVAMPGWVDDPAPFYGAANCFALASRRESFSNVVVEALAGGVPVVATDCGGPREILADGRYGRIVPVDDAGALAAALEACLADPGDPGRGRARAAEFRPEHALDLYEALIERVIAQAS